MTKVFNVHIPNRTLLLAVSEALIVCAALLAATFIGFGAKMALVLEGGNLFLKVAIASTVCLLCLYYFDLYDASVFTNPREVIVRLVQVVGTVCLVLAILYYTYPEMGLDIRSFLGGMVLVGILLAIWRWLLLTLSRQPRLAANAVLVGEGHLATSLASEIEKRPELGVQLMGYVGGAGNPHSAVNGLRCLGPVERLAEVVAPRKISRVIVTMAERRGRLPVEPLLQLKTRGVQVEDGAELYESVTGKVPIDSIRLSWLLFSSGFQVSDWLLLYKASLALVLSLACLVITAPLMGLIALAIWLDSGGPVIFRQTRIGKDGKPFTLYKFRSMRNGADADGIPRPAEENDPRCTRIGRWLRRTRLDELPQLYNILRGDMYFVGPRPFVPEEEAAYVREIPFYAQRWTVKPGATGWAQVHRAYCTSVEDNAEKLAYDLFYIKHMSIGLDVLVLFQTAKILLLGRGAQ